MAVLSLDDILECQIVCKMQNQVALNIRHFRVFNIPSGETFTEADFAATASDELSGLYYALLNNLAEYRGVRVRRLWPTETAYVDSNAHAGNGTAGADAMPKQVSGVISLRSNVPGRQGIGRVYVPFPAEQSNDSDSTPTATYVTNLGLLAAKLSLLLISNATPAVAQCEGLVYNRDFPPQSGIIINTFQRDAWGTQRRRGDFGRINTSPI